MTSVDFEHAESPLILTIDVGSSSVRTRLYDRLGRSVNGSLTRIAQPMHTTADGGAEHNADQLLLHIEQCIDATLAYAATHANRIGAAAMATFATNIVGIDRSGRALTPVYLYADTRGGADAAALRQQLDEGIILERTGCPLHTSYLSVRLSWFQRVYPEMARRPIRWVSLGEYLMLRLFGEARVSFSIASWSGLLNRRTLEWDAPLLATLDLDIDSFSPLADVDAPMSGLCAPYAQRWPALADIPWFPAIGDGAAANVGSGCTDLRRAALTIGTTGALRIVTPVVENIPWGLWCYRIDRQHALLGGATNEGGNIVAWLRDVLQFGDLSRVEQALAQQEPDAHGLTALPFLAGERSPGWSSNARACIVGVHLGTTVVDILRATLEAIAYRFALIAQLLDRALPDRDLCVASGGALLNSPVWLQIMADVLGLPIYASSDMEATSRGAALLALKALGAANDLEAMPLAYERVYEPVAERHARYAAAIERQQQLYAMVAAHNATSTTL